MTNWVIRDDNKGKVTVTKGGAPLEGTEKLIYSKSKARFSIFCNEQSSTISIVGYLFKYQKGAPKFCLFNSFFIANCGYFVDPEKLDFKPIFEDNGVRMLVHEHPNKIKDYWLVGRWRKV